MSRTRRRFARTNHTLGKTPLRLEPLEERALLAVLYGVDTNNNLLRFSDTNPADVTSIAITGLAADERVEAVDFRPAFPTTLYGLVIKDDAGDDTGRIATIDLLAGGATFLPFNFSTDGLTDGARYGFDFDPVADFIRVVNDDEQNLRVAPTNGILLSTETDLSTTSVVGLAYDRQNPTTLYGIRFLTDQLVRVGGPGGVPSPDGGVVTNIGSLGIVTGSSLIGFDIGPNSTAYMSATTGGVTRLYTVNLASGAVTPVGTIGDGSTSVRGLSALVDIDPSFSGTNGDDVFEVKLSAGDPETVEIYRNGVLFGSHMVATTNSILIKGLAGNDLLKVDSGNGLVTLPGGVRFDGGTGFDRLELLQTDTAVDPTITADDLVPGALPGSGVNFTKDDTGKLQIVSFQNIEPIKKSLAGPFTIPSFSLIAPGFPPIASVLQGDNAINYVQSEVNAGLGVDGTWGKVTIDNWEPIYFKNKTSLTINAGPGSDTVNLNNPSTPTALANIIVNGADPTASDTIIVNGTTGADAIQYRPTGADSGTVTVNALPPIAFSGKEHLIINGLGGGDTLTVDSVDIDGLMVLTDGPSFDSGLLDFFADITSNVGAPSLEYKGLGTGGKLSLLDTGQVFDDLIYRGTDLSDTFTASNVNATTNRIVHGTRSSATTTGSNHLPVEIAQVQILTLAGLAGDDLFNVPGNLLTLTRVVVDGGDPTASDVLNLTGSTTDVTVALGDSTLAPPATNNTVVAGYGIPVELINVEVANLDIGQKNLLVVGTSQDDEITYTPTGAVAGTFTNAGLNTVFNFTSNTGMFTIDGGANIVADTVIVRGSNGPDFIAVDSPNRDVQVQNPAGASLKTVHLNANVEVVTIQALAGNDTILVTPAPATATGQGGAPPGVVVPLNLLINIDGGSPGASDALVVAQADGTALPASDFVVINRSRTTDEGVVRVYRDGIAMPDIAYNGVEIVSPIMQPVANPVQDPNLMILGPDLYEQNEFLSTAAYLGSGSTINVNNLAIFPNALEHRFVLPDVDWFRVVAEKTGTIDFQVYFRMFAGAGAGSIPGGGNIQIEAYDVAGNRIDNVLPTFGTNDTDADERIRIPVVAGQTYYLRVFGAPRPAPEVGTLPSNVVNSYNLTVVNTAPPVPWGLEVSDPIALATTSGVATSLTFSSATATLSTVNDFYNGKFVDFTSGNANGLRGKIVDYDGVTKTFTLEAPLREVPLSSVLPLPPGLPTAPIIPAAGSNFQIESDDTGVSQLDDVTRDDTPTIFLRLDDGIFLHDLPGNDTDDTPPDQVTVIPFTDNNPALSPGYRIAIFDEGNTPPQTGTAPQTPVGFATATGQEGVYSFTFTTPLSTGSHFITARVQMIDPTGTLIPEGPIVFNKTGFGGRSLPLEIVIDTTAPQVFFGLPILPNDGLDPGSNSGDPSDNLTNNARPTLYGTAEANSIVRVYVDLDDDGVIDPTDLLIGQTVAVPLSGTNQFPQGRWVLTSNVDLNDPDFFDPTDGVRRLLAEAEDVAGNISGPEPAELDLFLDTVGPQVSDVFITDFEDFDLFGLKHTPGAEEAPHGPTPLVNSITVRLRDLPPRVMGFLQEAILEGSAEAPGVVIVRGDANGIIAIADLDLINDLTIIGQPATASLVITFTRPLPDDRFTLTILDDIVDPAGNHLDGESNAIEPQPNGPSLPFSGNGVPGGDFVARFTVDTRPEIGFYAGKSVIVDINGNGYLDPANVDATNRDLAFQFGLPSDQRFAGAFTPLLQGLDNRRFDVLAAYGRENGSGPYRFLIDLNGDGAFTPGVDFSADSPVQESALAVAFNRDGDPSNADEIGLFTGSTWFFLSFSGGLLTQLGGALTANYGGFPIAGDFDGAGGEDLGAFRNDQFFLDYGANGTADVVIDFGAPGVSERPVAADMDADGLDDIGLWMPGTGTDQGTAEWRFLMSSRPGGLNHAFAPTPLGYDLAFHFGDTRSLPIVGNFDPPVAPAGPPVNTSGTSGGSSSGGSSGQPLPTEPVTAANAQAFVASLYHDVLGRAADTGAINAFTSALMAGASRDSVVNFVLTSPEYYGKVVDKFYSTYLHRQADPVGRANWVGALVAGASEDQLAKGFLSSAEYSSLHASNASFVDALYNDILGRNADAGGRAAHIAGLNAGVSRADIVATFMSSNERYRHVVDQLYGSLLGRDADAAGAQLFSQELISGRQTARWLARVFLGSNEYYARR